MEIGKSIQQSFDLYLKNFVPLFLAGLIAGILSVVTLGILAGPLVGGFMILCLKLLRGEKGEWNEIFAHFDQFLPTFLVTLMLWASYLVIWIIASVPVIGWILQIAAGPALGILYFLTIGFVVDQKLKPLDALRRSIDCFATDPLMIWVYALLIGIISGVGAILLLVGIILTMPFGIVGYSIAYQQLSGKEVVSFSPEKKTLQISGIVLAVLLIVGLVSMNFGRRSYYRSTGNSFVSRILSFGTGERISMDKSGENFRIGNMSIGTGMPKEFPKDIPIYPNAEVGAYLSGNNNEISGSTTTFTTKDSADKIFEYYMNQLDGKGWEITTSEFGDMVVITLNKDNRNAVITINPSGSKTDILIGITNE